MNQLSIFENVWLDVKGYEGLYQVNGKGEVRSLNYNHTGKKKILKPFNCKGYLRVDLYNNNNSKQQLVHTLVYEAFYGNIPYGMEIDHINTIRFDNRVENLRCVTSKENSSNPITKERNAKSNKIAFSKPVIQLDIEGNFIEYYSSANEASRYTGINQSNISQCCLCKRKTAGGSRWVYA